MNRVPENPRLKASSSVDWASFGLEEIAYIRPIVVGGVNAMVIHSADSTPIGAALTIDLAMAAIIQQEMEPARVH